MPREAAWSLTKVPGWSDARLEGDARIEASSGTESSEPSGLRSGWWCACLDDASTPSADDDAATAPSDDDDASSDADCDPPGGAPLPRDVDDDDDPGDDDAMIDSGAPRGPRLRCWPPGPPLDDAADDDPA